MADRERSRSPDNGGGDGGGNAPPAAGDEGAPASDPQQQDGGGDAGGGATENGGAGGGGDGGDNGGAGGEGEGVKLYVGNLDYGTLFPLCLLGCCPAMCCGFAEQILVCWRCRTFYYAPPRFHLFISPLKSCH